MAIKKLLPGPHISEFAPASDGRHYNGTCTQASAAMAFAAALHPTWSQQQCIDFMVAMRDAMFARGACADNGAATVTAMAQELRNRGATILTEWDYAGDALPHDWHTLLRDNAGVKPILLQVAQAHQLIDTAGTHEDGGVQYHAIYIAGIADDGYVVYDPNNPNVMSSGDIYPFDLIVNGVHVGLQAASPCGLIMLDLAPVPAPQPPPSPVPSGWHDDGTTLTASNGVVVVGDFRSWCLSNMTTLAFLGLPLVAQWVDGDHTFQTFSCGEIRHTAAEGVFVANVGVDLTFLRQQNQAYQAEATVYAQIKTLVEATK